ncbi:MAG: lipid-A-disaccharide synthase [Bacteroidales bacterium]|jgi:lipid-A-disaccharide synthase|nr:lipid-A-disaccharide synthase [Bacteroidales bacterium]
MKYYLIAGEASGDLHAANLMKALKKFDPMANFRYWGGELMAAEGGQLVRHYRDTAFMGAFEVVMNLHKICRNLKFCKEDILKYSPDVLILVDYAGFNLRIASFAKTRGFRVFYYIAPKIWAWNTGRARKIKKNVDKLFSIMPFESDFYAKYNVPVVYSGNPLMDAIDKRPYKNEGFEAFVKRNNLENRPIIALLAGSRKQEISRLLPEMLAMVEHFPDFQFVIAGAPSFTFADYEEYLRDYEGVSVVFGQTYALLESAHAALVTSGTATLEAALLKCPQVVCYKMWGGSFTDFMAKKVIIKVAHISLVNLIMNREVVKELFQSSFSLEALKNELSLLCYDEDYRKRMIEGYTELGYIVGSPGSSERTARLMWESLKGK